MCKFSTHAVAALVLGCSAAMSSVAAADEPTCGAPNGPICTFQQQDTAALYACLDEKFGNGVIQYPNVTVGGPGNLSHGKYAPSPIDSSDDGTLYYKARRVSYGLRNPTAIVFAETTKDVVDAVNCARGAGYRVSARGRGHSTIGAAAADGALVIDLQYTCDVDAMVESIDRTKSGAHLVEGTRYIGTITAKAGCANANWLAAVYKGFDAADGAMASIGTCPSVGLVGFSLGGGVGDSTPIAGFAADLITEYEMVLADGSVVTASEEEHEDLYWANRGGGGGNGVITSLTFKVIQSPSPGSFTFFAIMPSVAGRAEWHVRFHAFQYDHPESYRFGGSAQLETVTFLFLGSAEEGIKILTAVGLLDQDLMEPSVNAPFRRKNFELICAPGDCEEPFPATGVIGAVESVMQAEAQAYIICTNWLSGWKPEGTGRSRDVCHDLNVDDNYCQCVKVGDDECYAKSPSYFSCGEKDVIEAMLVAATIPTSFMCHHGYDIKVDDVSNRDWPAPFSAGNLGGLVLPRISNETLRDLANNHDNPNIGPHLIHGASHMVPVDATALPWRDGSYLTGNFFSSPNNMEILLKDKAFGGDPRRVNGYYSYLGPQGLPNWEEIYFGSHVQKLKEIKARYDPIGMFDKPMQISGTNTNVFEPATDAPAKGKTAVPSAAPNALAPVADDPTETSNGAVTFSIGALASLVATSLAIMMV